MTNTRNLVQNQSLEIFMIGGSAVIKKKKKKEPVINMQVTERPGDIQTMGNAFILPD